MMDEQTSSNSLTTLNDSASLEGLEIKDSPFQLIGRCSIAAGSFGQVYLTRNIKTNQVVATKLVRKDNPNAKLKNEYECYRTLGPLPGLPRVYFFGECGPYDAMVMELLGPNLERVFAANNSRFSVRTTTQIAIMILEIMRYVHSKKIIFCNVKPENFCLGPPNTPKSNQVFMIGLINAKSFETADSRHIPKIPENGKQECRQFGVYGTPRYMSLNAHKGKELSRRDDLESIGYMLLYFVHGKLPWQGLHNNGQFDKCEHIYNAKKMIHLDELCANLPPEYYHYMLYVRSLKFAQEPNYKYLITMFTKLLYRINMDQTRLMTSLGSAFEWSEQINDPTTNNNNSNANQKKNINQIDYNQSNGRKTVSFKIDHEAITYNSDD